jgi:hypothetical protein
MKKKLKFRMRNYSIASLINIIPFLGSINGLIILIGKGEINFKFGILCLLVYFLGANIVRLSRPYRTVYISDNKIEYYNMFGLKRTILDSNIDLNKLNVINHFIEKQKINTPNSLFVHFRALFNLKHGNELRYKNKLIYRGLR